MQPDDRPGSPTVKVLLMSDMVDSTQLGARLGDEAMGEVWRKHDRLVRDLLAAWNGREIEKTDGVHALFDQADEALGCALAYHRGLREAGLPVKVRAGIHAGPVTLRRNAASDVARGAKPMEVDGLSVSIASRVMAIARGGQTLLSGAAVRALEARPNGLRAYGHWRLKGVPEPVEVFGLAEPGGGHEPQQDGPHAHRVIQQAEAWVPVNTIEHSLIAERDSFVGRQNELLLLSGRLNAGARLITVLGVGGSGKTRLALRFAWLSLAEYPGGVWFCDLSQARTIDGVLFSVAQGLGLPLAGGEPVAELANAIKRRGPCLVLLDNFEQVVEHANHTLGTWLDAAPDAQFIATSREALAMAGEEVLPLEPLAAGDSSELFIKRAQGASLGYTPSEADCMAIDQLVAALDGLPLAIELIAARVRAVAPAEMLARMSSRLDLTHAARGRVDRQATLRATFDWSWDLLNHEERVALAMLSVFEGSIGLDAAAAVLAPLCGARRERASALLDALVDKSLLRPGAPAGRYRMLETVREYAASRLWTDVATHVDDPAMVSELAQRHWRHYASLAARGVPADVHEADNCLAACRAASARGDGAAAVACLTVAWSAMQQVGPFGVIASMAEHVASMPALGDEDRALAHAVAAEANDLSGRPAHARRHLDLGVALLGERVSAGRARLLIAAGRQFTNDGLLARASIAYEDALKISEALGEEHLQLLALNGLGRHFDYQARWTPAHDHYQKALALAVKLGNRRMEGGLLGNLGGICYDRGDLAGSQALYERSLAIARELGDRQWEGSARSNLGLLYQEQGQLARAKAEFEIALDVARRNGNAQLEYVVLCNCGIVSTQEGDHERAGDHFEQAVEKARAAADKRSEGQFLGHLAVNRARRGLFDLAREAICAGEAYLNATDDQFSLGLLKCDQAEVEALAGNPLSCREAANQALEIAVRLDCGEDSELRRRVRTAVGLAKGLYPY